MALKIASKILIGILLIMPVKSYFISSATEKIVNESMEYYIHYYAKEYKVEEALIRAIIHVETTNTLTSIRYEAHLKRVTKSSYWYRRWLSKEELKDKYAYCSMGPMQILFGVAKAHGYKGTPFELLNPVNSIGYGTLLLKELLDKYQTLPEAISTYNQGSPRKVNGQFRNQKYVNSVIRCYMKYSK